MEDKSCHTQLARWTHKEGECVEPLSDLLMGPSEYFM